VRSGSTRARSDRRERRRETSTKHCVSNCTRVELVAIRSWAFRARRRVVSDGTKFSDLEAKETVLGAWGGYFFAGLFTGMGRQAQPATSQIPSYFENRSREAQFCAFTRIHCRAFFR
jgi:hypothetical protein